MLKYLLGTVVVLTVLVFASPNLSAASQTLPFGGYPNYSQTLTFDQYDGTLTGVIITLDLTITDGSISFDNDGSGQGNLSLELGADAGISSSDVPLVDDLSNPAVANLYLSDTFSGVLTGDDGDGPGFQMDGTDWGMLEIGTISGSSSGSIGSSSLAFYQGTGTFDIQVDLQQIMNIASFGGITGCYSPIMTRGSLTVEYIPEPLTIALFGFGGLMIRRRQRCEK